MHYLNHHVGSLYSDMEINSMSIAVVALDSFCIVAVNAYVLLSGYFLSTRQFSLRRLVCLLLQVLFYTITIPGLLAFLGVLSFSEILNPYRIWNSLFPVQSGQYWFMSAYVVMVLFSPFMNAALDRMEKKQLEIALAGLLVFFCVGKSISPLQFATDKCGYDFGWFLVLYLLGGYLRRFGLPFMKSAAWGWGVYLGSAVLITALELLLLWAGKHFEGLRYYTSVPFHYNFLLCFTGALGMFCGFARLQLKEGRLEDFIRFVSREMLGVYLIHEENDIVPRWCDWIDVLTSQVGLGSKTVHTAVAGPGKVMWFLAVLSVQTMIAFALCVAIDKLRELLFEFVWQNIHRCGNQRM